MDGVLALWRVEDGELYLSGKFYDFKTRITDLSLSRDHSNLLVATGDDGKVIVYNMVNRTILRTMYHPQRVAVDQVVLSLYPLACLVLLSKNQNTVLIYSVNGQFLASYSPSAKIISITLGTDGCFCDFLVDYIDHR